MRAPFCKICGTEHFSTQPCPVRDAATARVRHPNPTKPTDAVALLEKPRANPARKPRADPKPKNKIVEGLKEAVEHARASEPGTPVMVRLQAQLLARLDTARGGASRPEAIRRILEEKLP